MNLIVHIGLPKTGSTHIQQVAAHSRDILSSTFGVYWPICCSYKNGEGDTIGHHKLAYAFQSNNLSLARILLQQAVEAAEIAECERVLISSEGLSIIEPSSFASAINDLGFSKLEVVAYVRSPAELILSWYSQDVHAQTVFTNLMTWHSARKKIIGNMPIISRWKNTFPENISLRLYDRALFAGGDAWCDFGNAVFGIKNLALNTGVSSSNLSLKGNLFLIKKILNEFTFCDRVSTSDISSQQVIRGQADEVGVWWHLFNKLAGEDRFKGAKGYPLTDYEIEYLQDVHDAEVTAMQASSFFEFDIVERLSAPLDVRKEHFMPTNHLRLRDDVGWILKYVQENEPRQNDYASQIVYERRGFVQAFLNRLT